MSSYTAMQNKWQVRDICQYELVTVSDFQLNAPEPYILQSNINSMISYFTIGLYITDFSDDEIDVTDGRVPRAGINMTWNILWW